MPPVRRCQVATENESALTQNAMVGKLNDLSRNRLMQESVKHFKGWDKDDSKTISLEEFTKMAKNIPMLKGKDKSSLEETFRKIDVDESGDLTISEFHSFYTELKMKKKRKSNLIPFDGIELSELQGFPYIRKYIWITFDTYDTKLGKLCGPIVWFLISVSALSYGIETIPKFQNWAGWGVIEAVISIVFTIEFLLRFCTTWDKWEFSTEILNIIDLCSFLPFYIQLALTESETASRIDYLRVLRIC